MNRLKSSPTVYSGERTQCSYQLCILILINASYIVLYYVLSIGLTFYNNWVVKALPYPLSMTFFHLLVKFFMAWTLRFIYELWYRKKRVELNWKIYSKTVSITGVASAIDIGLSNWSLEFVTVSLYTMTKSTSIVFICLFSVLLKLEKKHYSLWFVVILISSGLILFTYESTDFNWVGFSLVLFASFISGIRWTSAQFITQAHDLCLSNPLDMIYHAQPWMTLALLPLVIGIEGKDIATTRELFLATSLDTLLRNGLIMLAGAIIAFGLEFAEYLVISRTSSLTLSIAAIFKEICVIFLATIYNGDHLSWINICGLVVCLSGIGLHSFSKAMRDNTPEQSFNYVQLPQQNSLDEAAPILED